MRLVFPESLGPRMRSLGPHRRAAARTPRWSPAYQRQGDRCPLHDLRPAELVRSLAVVAALVFAAKVRAGVYLEPSTQRPVSATRQSGSAQTREFASLLLSVMRHPKRLSRHSR